MNPSKNVVTEVPTVAAAHASARITNADNGKVGIFPVRHITLTHVALGENDPPAHLSTIMPFHRLISQQRVARALNRFNSARAEAT